METLCNNVKELRAEKGLSQEKLANMVGVTRQTIVSLEKGNYVPSLLLAMNIADALGRPIAAIFEREKSK